MARVFPGAVADTGPGTRARSSLSFLFVAREGKGLARCVAFAASGSGTLRRRGRRLHTANVVSVCLCVRHKHSRITARAVAAGGRARCHNLLYIQCGCVMQFGAKRCAQRARRGCTGHDGRAKPAWAARTGLAGAPHSVRRSRVPTSYNNPFHNGRDKQRAHVAKSSCGRHSHTYSDLSIILYGIKFGEL
jgi:hypothetical protein